MMMTSTSGCVRRCILMIGLVCATACTTVQGQSAGQLPSEGQLPGADVSSNDLPGEHQLPGESNDQPNSLPGEEQLPGRDPLGAFPAGNDPAKSPLGTSPPLLRLDFDGHTGMVRILALSDDGRTLISGGEDKDLHVWRRNDLGGTGWIHIRTVRWPVTRGPRGTIYACALKGDLAAFAGYGAFGSKGEIRIVNVASGELVQTLIDNEQGHLSNVIGLAWAPSQSPRLASIDMEGRLIVWSPDPDTGLWSHQTWVDVDARTYGRAVADSLQLAERRTFVPVTFLGERYLIVPQYAGPSKNSANIIDANWHLQRLDLSATDRSRKSALIKSLDHYKHVRDFATTANGSVLASCDWLGNVGVFRFNADGLASTTTLQSVLPPLCIDLSQDGSRLLLGTERVAVDGSPQAKLQIWNVQQNPPLLDSEHVVSNHVRDCILDLDNREVIAAVGSEIQLLKLDNDGKFDGQSPRALSVPAKPIQKVAFAKQGESYRVAFGWNRDAAGNKMLEGVFDLSDSKLLGRGPIAESDYLPAQRTAQRWAVNGTPVATPGGPRYQLMEGDQPRGLLPLVVDRHGAPTSVCTLPIPRRGNEDPNETPQTGAVIVGSSGENGIYAYQANNSDPPRLLRQFRDHSGAILSLSTSPDGRYLVSGSDDAMISVWSLQDLSSASDSVNAWGAEFTIESERLIADELRPDGPLYFRGVRGGDRLMSIEYVNDAAELTVLSDPAAMQQYLRAPNFDLLVTFKFTRLDRLGPNFQSLPAWRPLATLFVDSTREWAYWTPAGYYDASFNGHQRFGWQLNKGVDQPVDYFRAAQFRKQLERPDVMRRLLSAGSLTAAMQQTVSQIGPPPAEGAIVNQIENKPTIRLIHPAPDEVITGRTLTVEALIEIPPGASLVPPKAFVSGVPAVSREIVDSATTSAPNSVHFRWNFRLPSDPILQLEILAATETESLDRLVVPLEHKLDRQPSTKPRLHVIAMGVSRYQDPQIQSLDFAADAAGKMAKLFQTSSAEIYRTSVDQIVDDDATRPLWKVFAQSVADKLQHDVSPDDLVILYLCGHGLRDRRTDQWYFVTADARFRDLMNDEYADCISFSDLAALAQLPCRKLAILDSCHSGAVQPLMQRDDLKSALRFLQDDVVLTLTASEGDEEAAEQREDRMGRFTAALSKALAGAADELDADANTISLNEVIRYVTQQVASQAAAEQMPQHPTASPAYLLETLQLPLTSRQR
jgi:WD40 repeat protein